MNKSDIKTLASLHQTGAISGMEAIKAMGIHVDPINLTTGNTTIGSTIMQPDGTLLVNSGNGTYQNITTTDHTHSIYSNGSDITYSDYPSVTQYPIPEGEEIGLISILDGYVVLTDRNGKTTIIGKLDDNEDFAPIVAKKRLLDGSEGEGNAT